MPLHIIINMFMIAMCFAKAVSPFLKKVKNKYADNIHDISNFVKRLSKIFLIMLF